MGVECWFEGWGVLVHFVDDKLGILDGDETRECPPHCLWVYWMKYIIDSELLYVMYIFQVEWNQTLRAKNLFERLQLMDKLGGWRPAILRYESPDVGDHSTFSSEHVAVGSVHHGYGWMSWLWMNVMVMDECHCSWKTKATNGTDLTTMRSMWEVHFFDP
jgi:hypothetical protein